jgi:predicted DNA-binding ribbon-helix-helix protein
MRSPVAKRSVVLSGHKTSVSLEEAFWMPLKQIARERGMTSSELVDAIDSTRDHGNLSSAIRLFVLDYYRQQLAALQPGRGTSQHGDHARHHAYLAASGKARR